MKTTPTERLEILLRWLRKSHDWHDSMEHLVRWGFNVAQDDGDDHIARTWVEDYRTAHGHNTEKG
jgi:hypothetical protein